MSPKWFQKQVDALEHFIDSSPNHRVFAYEYDVHRRRKFLVATAEEIISYIKNSFRHAPHFYEVITPGFECQLYLDVEYQYEYNDPVKDRENLEHLLIAVRKLSGRNKLIVLSSCTERKCSYHVLVPESIYTSSNEVRTFAHSLSKNKILEVGSKSGQKSMVDTSPYCTNQQFRLLGCSKFGQQNHLALSEASSPEFLNLEFDVLFKQTIVTRRPNSEEKLVNRKFNPRLELTFSNSEFSIKNYYRDPETIVFKLKPIRTCLISGRAHRSNQIYYVWKTGQYPVQKCFSDRCKSKQRTVILEKQLLSRILQGARAGIHVARENKIQCNVFLACTDPEFSVPCKVTEMARVRKTAAKKQPTKIIIDEKDEDSNVEPVGYEMEDGPSTPVTIKDDNESDVSEVIPVNAIKKRSLAALIEDTVDDEVDSNKPSFSYSRLKTENKSIPMKTQSTLKLKATTSKEPTQETTKMSRFQTKTGAKSGAIGLEKDAVSANALVGKMNGKMVLKEAFEGYGDPFIVFVAAKKKRDEKTILMMRDFKHVTIDCEVTPHVVVKLKTFCSGIVEITEFILKQTEKGTVMIIKDLNILEISDGLGDEIQKRYGEPARLAINTEGQVGLKTVTLFNIESGMQNVMIHLFIDTCILGNWNNGNSSGKMLNINAHDLTDTVRLVAFSDIDMLQGKLTGGTSVLIKNPRIKIKDQRSSDEYTCEVELGFTKATTVEPSNFVFPVEKL